MHRFLLVCLVLVAAASCGRGRADGIPTNRVDSVIPWDSALARFRAPLPEVTSLEPSAPSLGSLIDTFLVRLERADTAGLLALTMTPAEFGWLYYPTVPEARPPYDLAPDLMWFMIEGNGRRSLTTLLDERAGRPLHVLDWRCDPPKEWGANRVHAPCLLTRLQAEGDTLTERLFGPIVERDGRFKFVNLAAKL